MSSLLKDKSAHLIAQYMPARAKPLFEALRVFNLETVKVSDTASEAAVSALKLDYWKQQILNPTTGSLKTLKGHVHQKYLLTMVETQQARLLRRPLRTLENMEQYGEGVYSQMNYATFEFLQTPAIAEYFASNPDLEGLATDTLAHIGQANGIAALLRGLEFYATKQNYLNLPLDLLARANLSEQEVLDAADKRALGNVGGLKDVLFEVATRANDHLLSASSLATQLRAETGKPPLCLVLPALTACPIKLYLEHLESSDFDLNVQPSGEWKLPWRTWRAYRTRAV